MNNENKKTPLCESDVLFMSNINQLRLYTFLIDELIRLKCINSIDHFSSVTYSIDNLMLVYYIVHDMYIAKGLDVDTFLKQVDEFKIK